MSGLVDYREARLEDPAWWRYLRVLFDGMTRVKDREIYRTVYDLQLALVSNGRLTDESWGNAQESANELKVDIISTHRPWEGRSFKDRQKKDFKDWRQRYIDAFGVDPYDEEFKKWEAETIQTLQTATDETETDDQRVARLLLERTERQRNAPKS